MDQAHVRHDQAHTPALQLADEVPLEQLSVRGHLRLEVLGAVLADEADAGLGEHRQILARTRTWSRRAPRPPGAPGPSGGGSRGGRGDLLAQALEIRADHIRPQAADQLNHATPA